jgi:hypothetical protein
MPERKPLMTFVLAIILIFWFLSILGVGWRIGLEMLRKEEEDVCRFEDSGVSTY